MRLILEEFNEAATGRSGDDGKACGGGFEKGVGYAFIAGRQDEECGCGVAGSGVDVAGEVDGLSKVEFGGEIA